MNPLVLEFLGAILRYLLFPIFLWMVGKGIITREQADTYMLAFIAWVIPVAWALILIYWKRKKLVTAMALPAGVSENEVKIAATTREAPPTSLKKDTVPEIMPLASTIPPPEKK